MTVFEIAQATFKMLAENYAKKPISRIFPKNIDKIANGCCVSCEVKIEQFRDLLSMKEYGISGLCQSCQNEVFELE